VASSGQDNNAIARSALIGALFDAWHELDLALAGVPTAEMIAPWGGGSCFAWTYGHVANLIDAWLNVRFQRHAPHPIIGDPNLRFGGSGRVDDWAAIERGVAEVRAATRRYLHDLAESALDPTIPYDGSIVALRSQGLSLRHAIIVNLTHHHYHIGEIATKRAQLGHAVPHLPGPTQRLPAETRA
jgi:hypothetical protein